MERTCALCPNPIPAKRRKDSKYCSDRCRTNSHYARHGDRIRTKWRENHPKVTEVRTCLNCGGEFVRGRSDQIYCTRYCTRQAWEVSHADELEVKAEQAKLTRLSARIERQSRPRAVRICQAEGCDVTSESDPAFKAGFCNMHYLVEFRANQRVKELGVRKCEGPGCDKDISRGRRNAKYCGPSCASRRYREDNLVLVRARTNHNTAQRRALMFNNPGYEPFTFSEWLNVLVATQFRCTYCKVQTERITMDHVVPLSKGGAHGLSNVVPACMSCNISKKDKSVEVWREWQKQPRRKRRRLF